MKRTLAIALMAIGAVATAQTGNAPTFKCVKNGKVSYSDEPCIGAIVVDTTPTQGLDKITGTSKKGADVRKEEHNKLIADGLKPIFGETPEQRSKRLKRANLPDKDKWECWNLDGQIQSRRSMDTREEVSLYQARKRYKDLKC